MAKYRRSKNNPKYFIDLREGGIKMRDKLEDKHCELCYAEIVGSNYKELDDIIVCFDCYEAKMYE